MGIEQFFFQVLDKGIVYAKLSFQGTVGHPPLALKQCTDLSHHIVEIHYRLSESTSSSAFASIRSAVSNPSVNHPYTGVRRSYASVRFPCCCHNLARLVAARSS